MSETELQERNPPRSQQLSVFWVGTGIFLALFSGFIYYLVEREYSLSSLVTDARVFVRETQKISLNVLILQNPADHDFSNTYLAISEQLEKFNRDLREFKKSESVHDAPIDLVESYLNDLNRLYALDLSVWYAENRYDIAVENLKEEQNISGHVQERLEYLGFIFKDYIATNSSRERRELEQLMGDFSENEIYQSLSIPVSIVKEVLIKLDEYQVIRKNLIGLDHLDKFSNWIDERDVELGKLSNQLTATIALMLIFCFGFIVFGQFIRNSRLMELSEQSKTLAQAKSEFLANMSHEIRTPLNAIVGFSSLLSQSNLIPRQRDYLNKIKSSSDSLLLLINDILDLTKVEAGKLELEEVEFDLDDQLEVLASMFSELVKDKDIEVIFSKDRSIPDYLRGDPLRLGQVIINLVSNAVKFTERGQIEVKLTLVTAQPLLVNFEVRDTGIGISSERIDELFGAFVQLDASTTRQYGGTGLGLNISRHLVDLMGGKIEVESKVGEGSVFSFELPFKPAMTDIRQESLFFSNPPRILLLEPNSVVQKIICDILESCGARIYTARTISEAHVIMEENGLLLQMAIVDFDRNNQSSDFLKETTESEFWNDLLILVLLKRSSYENIKYLEELGIDHYLSKPITEVALVRKVDEMINGDSLSLSHLQYVEAEENDRYLERLKGLRVLLAEDNPVNQQLVIEYMRQLEAVLEIADNGRMAVQLAAEHCFDVIIMDVHMPIMDGLDAARQMRKMPQSHETPIVALTASAMQEDREKCIAAGMNGFVTKPVSKIDLYHSILTVLGRSDVLHQKKQNQRTFESQKVILLDTDEALQRLDNDAEALCALLRLFMSEHQALPETIKMAFSKKHYEQLGEIIHNLKGSAANIAAKSLHHQCRALEEILRHQEEPSLDDIETLLMLLQQTCQHSQNYLAHQEHGGYAG